MTSAITRPSTEIRRVFRFRSNGHSKAGHLNGARYGGKMELRQFNPASIKAMIEGPAPAG
jgi:hypothetical protein